MSRLATVLLAAPGPTLGLSVTHQRLPATSGATVSNVLILTNTSDSTCQVRLTLVVPATFRLLNQWPASVQLLPHSNRSIALKFWIDQRWGDNETAVRIEAQIEAPSVVARPASTIQFVVYQSQRTPAALTYALEDERPYLQSGLDTLDIALRLVNPDFRPRTVRLRSASLPVGIALLARFDSITLPARRDTVVHLLHRLRPKGQKDQQYEVVIEISDRAGSRLGSLICRPVWLSSVKREVLERPSTRASNGVSVGFTYYDTRGLVPQVRTWGQTVVNKGILAFQADYTRFTQQDYNQLRNTYLQYERNKRLLRVGNLTDYHELMLTGVGLKGVFTWGTTKLEGWALRNQTNWFSQNNGPVADQTYSLRLTGQLPLKPTVTYGLSASHYTLSRISRNGFLSFATTDWPLNARARIRLLAGHSIEYTPGAAATAGFTNRSAIGWALGGNVDWQAKRVEIHGSAYLSSPVYGGLRRGASLVEHRLVYKRWPIPLSYRLSRVMYDQVVYNVSSEPTRRYFSSNLAELNLARRFNRLTGLLRPYYWAQQQALPGSVGQASESYRLLTSLTYEAPNAGRVEVSFDAGRFQNQAPATDQFRIGTYRLLTSAFWGSFSLMGLYQRGPYYLNDRLPGATDPQGLRQWTVSPTYQFNWFNGRLRGNIGLGLLYRSASRAKPWTGLIRHSAQFALTDKLSMRWSVNTLSLAEQIGDVALVPWQGTQLHLEMIRQFQRLPLPGGHRLHLRFYEDTNGNQQKDGSEPWLTGLLVSVNQTTLLTDQKGGLTYKTARAGRCVIRTVRKLESGEPVWFSDTIPVVKSVRREIPIRKTWRVGGQLRGNRSKFEDSSVALDRYRVEARHSAGETFRTYADADGRFNLYLPPGQYQFQVLQGQGASPVLLKPVDYRVEPGRPCPEVMLEIDTSSRPVKFKRFSK